MRTARPQTENRESFRFPVGDAVQGEMILADQSRMPVRLLDQSAGGLGVLTDYAPPVCCGDVVQLHTDSFCCEARVVHLAKTERTGGDNDESASGPQYRLGFIRLREIAVKSDEPERPERRGPWRISRPDFQQSPIAIIAVVFGIAVFAAVVLGVFALAGSNQGPGTDSRTGSAGSYAAGTWSGSSTEAHRNAPLDSSNRNLQELPGPCHS